MRTIHHQWLAGASTGAMALLALVAITPGVALAQERGDAALLDATEQDTADNREIVVTGTNISGVKAVGSQAISISRSELLSMGKGSLSEVLQTLPQVQNAAGTFSPAANGASGNAQSGAGGNTTRGNAINFRGVGQGATLILVDGHRITPNGTAGAFTEANQVPMAAIERIEVIADGASAIYGSDAIAGVINYVLRKDFSGIELDGRYTFGAHGNDEYALGGTAGLSWNPDFGRGNIIATFEYGYRMPYVRGRNPRLREDQRPWGGNDNRVNGNAATVPLNGNIVIPTANGLTNPAFPQGGAYTYYALPYRTGGDVLLSLADLQEVNANCVGAVTPTCASYANVTDRSDFEDYIGSQKRYQAAVFLSQEVGSLEFYDEFFWTRTEQFTRSYASGNQNTNPTVAINPDSPYYLFSLPNVVREPFPGAGFGVPMPYDVQFNVLARMPAGAPRFGNQNPDESFNNTFGVKAGLFGDWRGEAYYTYGQDKNCGVCYLGNYITLEATDLAGNAAVNALQQLVNLPLSDPMHVNPFSADPFTQAQLDYILGTNSQYGQNWSHDIVAKVDGGLFDLPAGRLKVAVGGEYYFGIQKLQNDANRPPDPGPVTTPDARARTTRTQWAAFLETYVPVVSSEMGVPLVQALTVSGAVRYDHYSDFGSTTNGKLSATWELNESLRLRGSWGTSFRAPGLPELNGGVFSLGFGSFGLPGAGVTGIPVQPNGMANVLNYLGNNPNLKPEKGRNWQIGADFTPTAVPGLRLSATYYNLSYKNKLGTSGVPLALFGDGGPFASTNLMDLYGAYVIPIHNSDVTASGCTLDPALDPYKGFLYSANLGFNPRDYCNINVVVDGRSISAADTMQDGLDMTAHYVANASVGTFTFDLSVSKIFTNTQRTVAGAPLVDVLDTIGNPISWRGRGNIGFIRGPFSATLMGNYVGPYTNDKPITILGAIQPISRVGAWTTFDLNLSLGFPRGEERYSVMNGVRLGVTITNLFDKAPPIVQSGMSGNSSIDLFTHNALGRFFQLQLTKAF
ncbi:MAG TPA: TonB-dependent receptor [Sphingobium sp.]|nr:TonB-dependent receptor [Sphingobium sp.]